MNYTPTKQKFFLVSKTLLIVTIHFVFPAYADIYTTDYVDELANGDKLSHVYIKEIGDYRSGVPGSSLVTLTLSPDDTLLQGPRGIAYVKLDQAMMDENNKLTVQSPDPDANDFLVYHSLDSRASVPYVSATFKDVPEDLKNIARLSGSIYLYNPDKSTKSRLVIDNFMAMEGKVVEDELLKKYGITFMFLTYHMFDQYKKDAQKSAAENHPLTSMQKNILYDLEYKSNYKNMIFYVDDPNDVLLDVNIMDKNGRLLLHALDNENGKKIYKHQLPQQPPSPEDKMMLYFKAPDTMKAVPFDFRNIKLH